MISLELLIIRMLKLLYSFYDKYDNETSYDSMCFSFSFLVCNCLSFVIAIMYYLTKIDIFEFRLESIGLLLFIAWIGIIVGLHRKKTTLLQRIKKIEVLLIRQKVLIFLVMFLMLALGIIAAILFKYVKFEMIN